MTLIKVKNKIALSLPILMRYMLKHVYEPEHMTTDERFAMEDSIVKWANKSDKTPEEQKIIEKIGWYLQKNEEGYFKERIKSFKLHDIDWRKYHRLTEAQPRGGYVW